MGLGMAGNGMRERWLSDGTKTTERDFTGAGWFRARMDFLIFFSSFFFFFSERASELLDMDAWMHGWIYKIWTRVWMVDGWCE